MRKSVVARRTGKHSDSLNAKSQQNGLEVRDEQKTHTAVGFHFLARKNFKHRLSGCCRHQQGESERDNDTYVGV